MSKYVRSESKCKYDLEKTFEIPIILPEHTYTNDDYQRVMAIYLEQIEATEDDYRLYDFNCDGKLTSADALTIQNIINGSITIPEDRIIAKIKIVNNGLLSGIVVDNILFGIMSKTSLENLKVFNTANPKKYILMDRNSIHIKNDNNTMQIVDDRIDIFPEGGNSLSLGMLTENDTKFLGITLRGNNKTTKITENGVTTTTNS